MHWFGVHKFTAFHKFKYNALKIMCLLAFQWQHSYRDKLLIICNHHVNMVALLVQHSSESVGGS
jgi:hypothetical protein